MKTTLGGQRLGSGSKQEVSMRNYERSTHDLSYVWRSTAAAGTLVPFMSKVALPGDSWKINLDADVMTHPTIGPLFGSFKVQLDVFTIPIRLYNGQLHMNALGVGMKMQTVMLPQIRIEANVPTSNVDLDTDQINPSCIFSYLGIRGVGSCDDWSGDVPQIARLFNAVPFLGYWDIYKNYYANKQEEMAAVIHHKQFQEPFGVQGVKINSNGIPLQNNAPETGTNVTWNDQTYMQIQTLNMETLPAGFVMLWMFSTQSGQYEAVPADVLFYNVQYNEFTGVYYFTNPVEMLASQRNFGGYYMNFDVLENVDDVTPRIEMFPLKNIDEMRKQILTDGDWEAAFILDKNKVAPYGLPLYSWNVGDTGLQGYSQQRSQEGLALKTYQSDLFNNWIETEWIDGDNGINAITAVDTSSGSFTIDALNMANKVFQVMNRIAISGGSYDDWLDAVYTHERQRSVESPVYLGGLSKELVFQEVVSTAGVDGGEPLGSLAGRGKLTKKHKGGYIDVKVDEPSYIMGIFSLTPRIDYSQGNDWDMNLKNLDELHKPGMDEIGFQDLTTDQVAYWDTTIKQETGEMIFRSAGKQPAWINYMTSVNKVLGNFAIQNQQMWMTLNRRYEPQFSGVTGTDITIKDLTTYIDPSKFNNIFADTRLDAQNFWVQIAVDISTRRKMSAKVIPNL